MYATKIRKLCCSKNIIIGFHENIIRIEEPYLYYYDLCITWVCVRSPFLRRSTPFCAFKRLIGLLERTVHQASGGF